MMIKRMPGDRYIFTGLHPGDLIPRGDDMHYDICTEEMIDENGCLKTSSYKITNKLEETINTEEKLDVKYDDFTEFTKELDNSIDISAELHKNIENTLAKAVDDESIEIIDLYMCAKGYIPDCQYKSNYRKVYSDKFNNYINIVIEDKLKRITLYSDSPVYNKHILKLANKAITETQKVLKSLKKFIQKMSKRI